MKACKKCGGDPTMFRAREFAEVEYFSPDGNVVDRKTVSGKISFGIRCAKCGNWIVGDNKEIIENRWDAVN